MVGVVTFVMLSVLERPLSLAAARSGVLGPPTESVAIRPWTVKVFTVRVLTPGPPALGPTTFTKLLPDGAPVTVRAVLMSPRVPGAAPSWRRNVAVVPGPKSPRKAAPTPAQSQATVAVGAQTPSSRVWLMTPVASAVKVWTPYGCVMV